MKYTNTQYFSVKLSGTRVKPSSPEHETVDMTECKKSFVSHSQQDVFSEPPCSELLLHKSTGGAESGTRLRVLCCGTTITMDPCTCPINTLPVNRCQVSRAGSRGVVLPVCGAPVVLPVCGAPVVLPVCGAPVVLPVCGAPVVLPVCGAPVAWSFLSVVLQWRGPTCLWCSRGPTCLWCSRQTPAARWN